MANSTGILYDLEQDLLLNDEIKSLKKIALLYIVPKFFSSQIIIKYAIRVYPEITTPDCDISFKKSVWENIEKEVAVEIKRFLRVQMDWEIVEITHFVANQIFLFLAKNEYPYLTLIKIVKNFVFTRQGTINMRKTFDKVLLNGNLSGKEKFEIACKSFMSLDIIINCYALLTHEEIDSYVFEDPVIEENIPIHFFLCQIRCYTKKIETLCFFEDEYGEFEVAYFSELCTRCSTDYLALWAVFTYNDLAVRYTWENYISIASGRYFRISILFSYVIGNFRMANSVIYLLSKISDTEIEIFYQVRSKIIFEYLLLHLKWQSSFFKVLEVLHRGFETETFITILKFMISDVCSDRRDKFSRGMFREFLTKMTFEARFQFLLEYQDLYYNLLQTLYNNDDLESCAVLLEINGPLNKDNLFSTNLVTILFDMHILSGKFHVVHNILKFYFKSTAAIKEIIIMFYSERAPIICQEFIIFQELDKLILFINWCLQFVPIREIMVLKYDILFMEKGKLIKELIFKDPETDHPFQVVDEFLKWCLCSEISITNFKNCIKIAKETENNEDASGSDKINVYLEIAKYVSKFQFYFLHLFYEWKPCSDEEISEVRNSLLNDSEFYRLIFRKRNVERNVLNFFSPFIGFIGFIQ